MKTKKVKNERSASVAGAGKNEPSKKEVNEQPKRRGRPPKVRTEEAKVVEVKKSGDAVNHPPHYTQGGIECIDAIAAATVGLQGIEAACTANILKYLWRWKKKEGLQDLQKAQWYLNRLLAEVVKGKK